MDDFERELAARKKRPYKSRTRSRSPRSRSRSLSRGRWYVSLICGAKLLAVALALGRPIGKALLVERFSRFARHHLHQCFERKLWGSPNNKFALAYFVATKCLVLIRSEDVRHQVHSFCFTSSGLAGDPGRTARVAGAAAQGRAPSQGHRGRTAGRGRAGAGLRGCGAGRSAGPAADHVAAGSHMSSGETTRFKFQSRYMCLDVKICATATACAKHPLNPADPTSRQT